MKTNISFVLAVILQLAFISKSQSQNNCSNIKVLGPSKLYPVTPLPIIDERDVMWHRRLWREIDLKEKNNQLLYFPKEKADCSFYDILFSNLKKGYIKAYHPKDDHFSKELTVNELVSMIGDSIYNEDKEVVYQQLESRDVVKIWLKEDWIFNSKYSKIDVRIVGICPVKANLDKDGILMGYEQLFWLYFPNIRGVLTKLETHEGRDSSRTSFDDVFIKRMFDSYIIQKEDGEKHYVKDHKTELDIKLENEKTKIYHYKKESNLWGN